MNSKKAVVMNLLKERHRSFIELDEKKAIRNPHWHMTRSMPKSKYQEWLEYGVNLVSTEMGLSKEEAEKEMSWIENEYRLKLQ